MNDHAVQQYRTSARRPFEAILAPLAGGLFTVLDTKFRERILPVVG